MKEYQLISDYRDNIKYKESFNELAKKVFALDFQQWYDRGFWSDNYICYSYLDGNQVIANASVNKMDIVSNGKEYRAIQVGTVMTHPDYRHQGLAAKLMNHIIKKYEKDCDFIYLFANDTVLDFYPKFGFEKVQESSFSLKTCHLKKLTEKATVRKLDINNQGDFALMKEFAVTRTPVSSILGVKNNEHLLMFYLILVFHDAIYYVEEEDVIIIFEQQEHELHIFDIISKKRVGLEIINCVVSTDMEVINFYFTADFDCPYIETAFITNSEDTLFVRPVVNRETKHFLWPLTSHS
ncbi:GNAT family N-acetyltransferase [Lysinibacillus parviboronicapiens]|uniref:GNAT family N-acetyltransferase n=1 Tax=Lysinibacillus parviboronicapiens TaxID=436516 RepID=UPI000D3C9B60|nr:GNAT family N-acetyltransferase [Lysinibacillus parviboronicapiens]